MNYGEELAYWYLRLNGFFPLRNYVVHRTQDDPNDSDVDILAVRPPHVFEEVGGQMDDWDSFLIDNLDLTRTVGLICEVKTGRVDEQAIFRQPNIRAGVGRLGILESGLIETTAGVLGEEKATSPNGSIQFAKMLISKQHRDSDKYFCQTLRDVRSFIQLRIEKYPVQKYAARLFFPSAYLQDLIDRTANAG